MSFNRALLVLWAATLSGCSFLADKPKPSLNLQKSNLNLSCLKETPVYLQELFEGRLTESKEDQEKVDQISACLDKSLEVFTVYTRGETPDIFSAKELQIFANRYLPENSKINDGFLLQIFELKKSVLGGTVETITKNEVNGLRANLKNFWTAIKPLAPHIKVLMSAEKPKDDSTIVAIQRLQSFAIGLSEIFLTSKEPVRWNTIAQFGKELEGYLNAKNQSSLSMLYEQADLYRYLKLLFVGGSSDSIEPERWKMILTTISSGVATILLNRTPIELIENIQVQFQSSTTEQRTAIDGLEKSLLALVKDSSLKTTARIRMIASIFARARIILELLFMQIDKETSLEVLLKEKRLRKAENLFAKVILDQDRPRTLKDYWIPSISSFTGFLESFIETFQGSHSKASTVSLGKTLELIQRLEPLFESESEFTLMKVSVQGLWEIGHFFSRAPKDELTLSDLLPVLKKIDQVLNVIQLNQGNNQNMAVSVVQVLSQAPEITKVEKSQLRSLIQIARPLMESHIKLPKDLDPYLDLVFAQKKYLWGSSDLALDTKDLQEIAYLIGSAPKTREPGTWIEWITGLNLRWTRSGFQPTLSWKEFLKEPSLKPYLSVLQFFFPAGVHSLSLKEFVDLSREGLLISQDLQKKPIPMEGLKDLLSRRIPIIPKNAEILISDLEQIVQDPRLKELTQWKSELFGTARDRWVRKDFEIMYALLQLKNPIEISSLQKTLDRLMGLGIPKSQIISFQTLIQINSRYGKPEFLKWIEQTKQIRISLGMKPENGVTWGEIDKILSLTLRFQAQGLTAENLLSALALTPKNSWTIAEVIQSIDIIKTVVPKLKLETHDIKKAFSLNAALWKGREDLITRKDLIRLIEGYHAFQSKKLDAFIDQNPIRPIPIKLCYEVLWPYLKPFLKKEKIPLQLNASSFGQVKKLIFGGSQTSFDQSNLKTAVKWIDQKSIDTKNSGAIPSFDLDSKTFLWISSAIETLSSIQGNVPLVQIETLITDTLKNKGFLEKRTFFEMLYPIWRRALNQKNIEAQREQKFLPHEMLTKENLKDLSEIAKRIGLQFQEIEKTLPRPESHGTVAQLRPHMSGSAKTILNRFRPIQFFIAKDKTYRTYFPLTPNVAASYFSRDLKMKVLVHEIVQFLFPRYSNDMVSGFNALQVSAFASLLADLQPLMLNFKLLYRVSDASTVAKKQMKTINLFVHTSDGNHFVDVNETVEFMVFSMGLSPNLKTASGILNQRCGSRLTSDGVPAWDVLCVKNTLNDLNQFSEILGKSTPGMRSTFSKQTLKFSDPELFDFIWSLAPTPPNQSNRLFDSDQLQSFITAFALVESLFQRFDSDHNQKIDGKEAERLFPNFCTMILEKSNNRLKGSCEAGGETANLKWAYLYILRTRGETPGLLNIANMGDFDEEREKIQAAPLNRIDFLRVMQALYQGAS